MPARWVIVPFEQIESYIPKSGLVIDIGCGEGVMATLLAVSSASRQVMGMDVNRSKIELGNSVARKIRNLSFQRQDVLKQNLPGAEGFILSDFLHHISLSKHKILLKKIADSLKKGGVMIIKEIDVNDTLRSKISRVFDFLFYPGQKVSFVNSQNLANYLKGLGFEVKIIRSKKWFPGSTTLFVCKKMR